MRRQLSVRIAFGVLLAAFVSATGLLLRAEPPQAVGTWATLGSTPESRMGAAAVALSDGRTVIAGGSVDGAATDSVVVFNPADGSFATAGNLLLPRVGHSATLLDDGRILIAGGTSGSLISADLELFDPLVGMSVLGGAMVQPRTGHAAAKLANGKVLLAGGTGIDGVLQTAEIYDPATGTTSATTLPMLSPRTGASATTLIDGRVLIAGGNNGTADLASAELFEASSQIFEAATTSLSVARSGHAAVLLPWNNSVLIAGGSSNGVPQQTSDLFLPAEFPDPYSYGMGSFAPTGSLITPRSGAVASPHVEGYAVAMGGGAPDAEVYRFATIKTDKDDYAPGELALITGSGWEPDSEVTLLFQEDPAVHDDYVLHVPTDGEGNFSWNQWAPEQHDLNVRFYLMAKQATPAGERRAQTTLTDANPAPTVTIVTVSDTLLNASEASTDVTWKADQTGNYEVRVGGSNCGQGTVISGGSYTTANANLTTNILSASLSEGANTIRVCVTNIPNPPKTGDNTTSVTKDSVSPDTSITAQPTNPSNSTSASFSFTGTDPAPSSGALTFECDLDGGGFAACTSPKAYASLSTGSRTFQVRARDAAGNIDASPASFTWTIDTTAPTINSVTGPANGSYRAGQNLDFTVNYNDNVTVTGTPTIGLTVGATGRNASYVSGSGSSALLFRYVVQGGETDSDGITSASPIALNGGTIRDAATNNAALTFAPPDTTGVLVDTTSPTAAITYSPTGPVKAGTSLMITATFSEPMADSPVVRFSISGANTMAATNMTKTDSTHYTGTHVVGAGNGAATVALSVGTDVAGNVITSAPTSGATFTVDNTSPTAAITYSINAAVNSGTSLTITATFNESMADSPVVKLGISGANTLAATNMTKTDSTHYTYVHTVGAGNGAATVALSVGTDVAGNVITSAPTSGATFTVDNTPPGPPTVPDLASGSDSGISTADDITNVTSNLKFSGMADGNSTIKLFIDGSGTPAGTDTANGGGSWNNVSVAGPLSEGPHTIRATATDAAGNESGLSAPLSFRVDTTGPTVTIDQAVSQADPANVPPINFTAVFNESVFGFATGDATFAGSTAPGVLVGTITGTGPYNVAVTGMTAAGTVVANIAAGVATDAAGNTNTAATFTDHTVTYNPDSTAPVVTVSFGAPDGDNNWFKHSPVLGTVSANDTTTGNSNVTAITCLDGVTPLPVGSPSGIGTPSASGTLSVSGEGTHNISCTASDSAGNTGASAGSTAMPVVVKIDTVKPTATATPDRAADHNGWYNHALTIHFSGSDATSDIASCTANNNYSGPDTASASVQGTCTDNAGNVSDAAVFNFNYDGTGPTAALSVTAGTAGTNGWYTSDVTVHTTGSDPVSDPTSCTADQFQTTDTMGQLFNGSCMNDAGLTTDASALNVKLDKTAPTAVALAVTAGTLGSNGWYTSDVTVRTSGTETTSTPLSCTTDQYQTTDTSSTGHTFSGSCTNDAGWTTNASDLTVKRDASPPTVTATPDRGPDHNTWYNHGLTIHFAGDDPSSGIASCDPDNPYSGPDTASASVSGHCTNGAGLQGTGMLDFKYDATKPHDVVATPARLPDHSDWYNHALHIDFEGQDETSGIGFCSMFDYSSPDSASAAVNGTCTDNAGNTTSPATQFSFKFDASAPTVDATPDRPADHNGWYNDALTIHFSATDAVSGVESCDADDVYSGPDTMTASASGQCTNGAGLMSSGHYDFRYDATRPYNVSGAPNRSADHNGWYNHAVDVAFHGTDDTSGIDACSIVPYSGPDTPSTSVNGNCTDVAGNTSSPDTASSSFRYDATPPSAALAVTAGTPGTNGWYTSDVTVSTSGTDSISNPTTCTADQFQMAETGGTIVNGDCTNDAGLTGHAAPLTVKLDKTAPTAVALAVTSGTLGLNGWYTTNVTVGTSGTETIANPIMCTPDQFQTTDTTGQVFHGACTNDAGLLANADALTIKRDATAPTLTLFFMPDGPDGNAGWWKTPGGVPFNWTCTDATSMIDATYDGGCPSPLTGTVTANGTTNFDDRVRDQAGNLSTHVMRTLQLDNVAPVVNWNMAGDSCSLPGNAGWCRGTQTAAFMASDVTSGLAIPAQGALTPSTGTNGGAVTIPSGSVGDVAGNINTGINAGPYKIDSVAPNISLVAPANSADYVLNAAVASIYSCSDPAPGSSVATCAGPVASGANFSTNPVAGHSFTVNASDVAGNSAAATNNYSVAYSTSLCLGQPGHQILQPINADNSSVFKQKSTVPAKFRVCDANGVSVGTPGVVTNFYLVQVITGTVVDNVTEPVDSTTPDLAFRWSATDQQWIFNINTKSLMASKTYIYRITLNDGSTIQFQFGLK